MPNLIKFYSTFNRLKLNFALLAGLLLCPGWLIHAQNASDTTGRKREARMDSIRTKTEGGIDKITGVADRLAIPADTLNPDIPTRNNKLDSLRNGLAARIDSLNQLGQPPGKYVRLLDSLNQVPGFRQLDKAEQKMSDVQRKMAAPGNQVGSAVNDKLTLMNNEGGSGANIPGQVNVPGVSGPGLDKPELPGIGAPNANINGGLDLNLPSTGIDEGVSPQKGIGNIPGTENLKDVKESLGKVSEVTGDAKAYGDDIKNASSGNLEGVDKAPKMIESKVGELDEVKGIKKEMGGADQIKQLSEGAKGPEALKEMAKQQVVTKAVNHFAGQDQQLQGAMQRVSSLKQKYSSVKSIKDIQKHPPNPMKDKPFIERVVPGLVLQLQVSDHLLIDFNPVVGYRIGGKVNAGAGWNYRLAIGKHFKTFYDERIYGPRVYGEFKFGKGFAARADIEKMNTLVPPYGLIGNLGEGSRHWVWSVFVGLKKEYKFMKHVEGNFQFLYNIYDDHDNSPYADRLVVRTGFEFPQRKKHKPKAE